MSSNASNGSRASTPSDLSEDNNGFQSDDDRMSDWEPNVIDTSVPVSLQELRDAVKRDDYTTICRMFSTPKHRFTMETIPQDLKDRIIVETTKFLDFLCLVGEYY
ncbi:hypothetical protein P7C70_g8499, partial [Phenoliferia sp. Uapishka_3]